VDKQGLFDVKEPLVAQDGLEAAARRLVVGTIGAMDLGGQLREAGFNASEPTTWLMEGLAPYLTVAVMHGLAKDIGALSAPGSALWLDGFSETSVAQVLLLCCTAQRMSSDADNKAPPGNVLPRRQVRVRPGRLRRLVATQRL
jgi:O-methyltransferase involved in polyketide biosynthesis